MSLAMRRYLTNLLSKALKSGLEQLEYKGHSS